ncbi:MAG: pyridoxal phosphate-dependent aminotransferase [Clostridia bacterium]|nr:pyridoxal phosphate-dependent aminotransferase [Clostridia bacterium]
MNEKMLKLGKNRSAIREIFEFGNKLRAEIGAENVYDFSLGNPYPPAPDCLTETLEKLIKNPAVHAYTSAPGAQSVREAVANSISTRFGLAQPSSLIYMTAGAAASLCSVLSATVACKDDKVVVFAPYFPEYKVFIEATGATVSEVMCNDKFLLDRDNLEKALDKNVVALIINSPNNPTGAVYPKENLQEIFDLLEKKEKEYGHPIIVICDEPYRELVYGDIDVPYIPTMCKNSVVCYSYSKVMSLPGERIGYVAVSPNMDNAYDYFSAVCGAGRSLGYVCAPSLFQFAVAENIDKTSDFTTYANNGKTLYNHLTKLGLDCVNPDGAFYLFVKAPFLNAEEFCEKAKKYNILLVPSTSFGVSGYVRISYCVSEKTVNASLPAFTELMKEYK